MRLQLGQSIEKKEPSPAPEGWQPVQSRLLKGGYWLAALLGLVVMISLWVALGLFINAVGARDSLASASVSRHPWLILALVLVLFVPLHEAIHLLGQPGWGFSSRSVVILWPSKIRFGVYYDGIMSRRRWLWMRLAPLFLLSVLPIVILGVLQFFNQIPDLEVGLSILIIANSLGSGADVLAALAVAFQVPRRGRLRFVDGRGYWQTHA